MKNKTLSIIVNAFIAVLTAVSYNYMYFRWASSGLLSGAGLLTLRYFTVLSNLFEGIVSIVCVIFLIKNSMPRWLATLKYVAAVAVGLTFFTVILFLGPVFGYGGMFLGANLAFHLIIPVVSMLEYIIDKQYPIPTIPESVIALAPMIIYGSFYMGNIIINGLGEPGNTNDWYGFAAAGFPASYFVFAFIALATWVMAFIFRSIKKLTNK